MGAMIDYLSILLLLLKQILVNVGGIVRWYNILWKI